MWRCDPARDVPRPLLASSCFSARTLLGDRCRSVDRLLFIGRNRSVRLHCLERILNEFLFDSLIQQRRVLH